MGPEGGEELEEWDRLANSWSCNTGISPTTVLVWADTPLTPLYKLGKGVLYFGWSQPG